MCKFHQDVARAIAADPTTGQIDPLIHALATMASARFWIDRYMPTLADLDGYSRFEMARPEAVTALARSGLDTDITTIDQRQQDYVPQVREAILDMIDRWGLTLEKLQLPKNYYARQGVVNRGMFIVYDGDPADERRVCVAANRPRFEPMRRAMEELHSLPGITDKIEIMIKGSIARLMVRAQSEVNPQWLAYYDAMPKRLRTAFGGCAMHGAGLPVAVHGLTCGLPLLAGGGSGLMLGGLAASLGVPAVAAALDTVMTHFGGRDISISRAAIVFATAVGISTGSAKAIEYVWPHEHLSSDKVQVLAGLTDEQRAEFLRGQRDTYNRLPEHLRQRVDEAAAKEGMTPDIYLYGCDFSDELGQAIMAEIRQWKAQGRAQSATFRVATP